MGINQVRFGTNIVNARPRTQFFVMAQCSHLELWWFVLAKLGLFDIFLQTVYLLRWNDKRRSVTTSHEEPSFVNVHFVALLNCSGYGGCELEETCGTCGLVHQIYDEDIDKVNKPFLPVAAGELTHQQAWMLVR